MCICLGNRAFIIVGVVRHGSFEDYHTEIVWCYVHFVRIRIFIIVAFAGHGELRVLAHRNIMTFKFSCIEINNLLWLLQLYSNQSLIDVTGHGNLQ